MFYTDVIELCFETPGLRSAFRSKPLGFKSLAGVGHLAPSLQREALRPRESSERL
jgi:hypothetical protein